MQSLNSTISLAIFALVAIPFLLIAIAFIIMIMRSDRKAHASERWTPASGRILSSEVTSHRSLDSNGTHSTIYEPAIQYEYMVNGQRLQSTHVRFGMAYGTSWTKPAQDLVDKYPQGTLVQVFYNPANPGEAVLEHSTGGSNRLMTCVVIFILGMLVLVGGSIFVMQGFTSQIMKLIPHF
jgi:hypothetical protein